MERFEGNQRIFRENISQYLPQIPQGLPKNEPYTYKRLSCGTAK
jgi:hypothetical protein